MLKIKDISSVTQKVIPIIVGIKLIIRYNFKQSYTN